MPLRFRSPKYLLLALVLAAVAVLAAQDPKPVTGVKVAAPLSGSTAVTNASTLLFDAANLTDVAGYRVTVDGGAPIDLGMPATQTALGGGGVTFSIQVSSLSLTNGTHTLLVYAYNDAGTASTSPGSLVVTKS